MNQPKRIETPDAEVLRREYERLRANALGELNRPRMLMVLVCQGMSAWLRVLINSTMPADRGPETPPTVVGTVSEPVRVPGAEVAAILVDAILEAVRPSPSF